MVQNLKKVLKSKISKFFSFLRHEVPFKAKNNREAVVVCAKHVVKRPSKRSVLVIIKTLLIIGYTKGATNNQYSRISKVIKHINYKRLKNPIKQSLE